MPWSGDGEFPTLGFEVVDWIEASLIVPDRDAKGEPLILTGEQIAFVADYYRLDPVTGKFVFFRGGQLMRPQKWGKDPLAAAVVCAEALGPTRFDGWDAHGEPVGRPLRTPLIQCAATAEEQVDNTWTPIYTMLSEGPIAGQFGTTDVGLTRVNIPGGGSIEPVSMSARARLGAPITFCTFTESHLLVDSTGGTKMAAAMKRNVGGMGGRWLEVTNAYDPSEHSVAQLTAESAAKDPNGVLVDYRPPRKHTDLAETEQLAREVIHVYGDSSIHAGGWVDEQRIIAEIRDDATLEADARRFFLNQIVAGAAQFVDPLIWSSHARVGEQLQPGDGIALGFDGSRRRDATALIASRMSDGRLFQLAAWEKPTDPDLAKDWRVPTVDVDLAVKAAFDTYEVTLLYADPWGWESYLDAWSALWPSKVVRFEFDQIRAVSRAIERFLTDFKNGEITHDGSDMLSRHMVNTVVVKGPKRQASEETGEAASTHYLKLAKKKDGLKIDAAVAAVLAREARAQAVAKGLTGERSVYEERGVIFL